MRWKRRPSWDLHACSRGQFTRQRRQTGEESARNSAKVTGYLSCQRDAVMTAAPPLSSAGQASHGQRMLLHPGFHHDLRSRTPTEMFRQRSRSAWGEAWLWRCMPASRQREPDAPMKVRGVWQRAAVTPAHKSSTHACRGTCKGKGPEVSCDWMSNTRIILCVAVLAARNL